MTPHCWTPHDLILLRHLWARGHSFPEIARRLGQGKTASAVRYQGHSMGLPERAMGGRGQVKMAYVSLAGPTGVRA